LSACARWFTQYDERETQRIAAEACYLRGDLAPLVAFIETRFFPILSNRDYRWTNELAVKIAFLTLLFDDWAGREVTAYILSTILSLSQHRLFRLIHDASFSRRVSGLSVHDSNPPALAGGC
jgi:hypothetical protein